MRRKSRSTVKIGPIWDKNRRGRVKTGTKKGEKTNFQLTRSSQGSILPIGIWLPVMGSDYGISVAGLPL